MVDFYASCHGEGTGGYFCGRIEYRYVSFWIFNLISDIHSCFSSGLLICFGHGISKPFFLLLYYICKFKR